VNMPIFASAAGRAFFAFSDAHARAEMLRHAPLAQPVKGESTVADFRDAAVSDQIRHDGYAAIASIGSEERLRGNAAIAVPVCPPRGIAGVLSLVFFGRAIPLPRAVATLVPPLTQTAERIALAMTQTGGKAHATGFAGRASL
jgi:DNA-binding IclR family transcriptional regulator